MKEKQTFHVNGYLALIVLIALMIGGGYLFYDGIVRKAVWVFVISVVLWIVGILLIC